MFDKEALKYLVSLGEWDFATIAGQSYTTKPLHLVMTPVADTLHVRTLTGLVNYIESEVDTTDSDPLLVHVAMPDEVRIFTPLLSDRQRECLMVAHYTQPRHPFGVFEDVEQFIINMQIHFKNNKDLAKILKLVGNMRDEAIKTYGDDGVTQSVTAKTGIATVDEVPVPNPVVLAPFRTFAEVEQPESQFVLRIQRCNDGPRCALFEADGGKWELEAISNIANYLSEKLKGKAVHIIS